MRGQGYLTPIDRFFVRNHTATPEIDRATWRLRVHGTGVRRELSLSYDDLLRLPSVTVTRAVECAGNGRSFFDTQQGTPAAGTQWSWARSGWPPGPAYGSPTFSIAPGSPAGPST